MNVLAQAALLISLPAGVILAGYWLAGYLRNLSAEERVAVASLAGLAVLLWSVTVVNLFRPIAGIWAWACLWPIGLTLSLPSARAVLLRDTRAVLSSNRSRLGLCLGAIFLVALIWPVLRGASIVFYDGTSNHDSFFWIASAEYLKRNTYLSTPVASALHPVGNAVGAITGWKPVWGRMGAEGLLALVSSLSITAAIKIYICATATLFLPWISGVFLTVKTFLQDRSTRVAVAALVLIEPLFIFFHGNSNLPNLLGILMGAAIVIASERALRPNEVRWPWFALLALSFHGLLCSYPEMLPFVLLPAGLLWLRRCFIFKPAFNSSGLLGVSGAFVLGAVLNPASSWRAYYGFISSFATARANQNWANLFEPLKPTEYLPAMVTLCVSAGRNVGPYAGAVLSIGLLVGLILMVRRSRDAYGALAMMAGTGVLIVYTIKTGFNYGWQKAIQFGGVFCAALVPVGLADYLWRRASAPAKHRLWARLGLVALLGFGGYATTLNILEEHKWSRQKMITEDWFRARDFARDRLRDAPVLIDAASFRMAFFHGMWATYFLPDSDLYFASRGKESGGYVRDSVINEATTKIPEPKAYFVSRDWANTFDANSPRLFTGDTLALLGQANRVFKISGLYPENGVPTSAQESFSLTLRPHSRSQLLVTLGPSKTAPRFNHWKVVRKASGSDALTAEVTGQAPWNFTVPLAAGIDNQIEITAERAGAESTALLPYVLKSIRIESLP